MNNYMKTIISAIKLWVSDKIKNSTADWAQNDNNSDSYIKNRTHYEYMTTISWTHQDLDLKNVKVYPLYLADASDEVINGIFNSDIIMYGEIGSKEATSPLNKFVFKDYVVMSYNSSFDHIPNHYFVEALLVLKDNTTVTIGDSVEVFKSKGLYVLKDDTTYVSAIAYRAVKTLDDKFVSNNIARKFDITQPEQSDWNQNDETALDYIKNRICYEDSTSIIFMPPTELHISYDGDYSIISDRFNYTLLEVGKAYKVILNDIEYECVVRLWNDAKLLGNGTIYGDDDPGNDEPFAIDFYENGEIYFNSAYAGDYIISILDNNYILKQIDEKYIPDTIARTSNIPQADWNQSDENAPDYIKNRTHYEEEIDKVVLMPKTSWEFSSSGPSSRIDESTVELVDGETYTVVYDGVKYQCKAYRFSGVVIGNTSLLDSMFDNTGEPFLISSRGVINGYLVVATEGMHTFEIYTAKNMVVHQIDEKYIPDTIARMSDINGLTAFDIGALPDTTVIPSVVGLATETYVDTKVANLVNSAPDKLNTLDELAAALGDDENFANTMATSLSNKLDKSELNAAINAALAQAKASGEFDGEQGEIGPAGNDGVSVAKITQTTTSTENSGDNIMTVTLSDGQTSTFSVRNGSQGSAGEKGEQGPAGYSPVRGTDYWTDEDIAEIKSYVDEVATGSATTEGILPEVSEMDNGAFLCVVNGQWSTFVVPHAEEVDF